MTWAAGALGWPQRVSRVRADRVAVAQQGRTVRAKRRSATPTTESRLLGAGNRAVAQLLQRYVGWRGKDVVTAGHAWNAGERAVGKVRRIPLEGLAEGLKNETASKPVYDKATKKWSTVQESTKIGSLSTESAVGRAIVLVPDGLDATRSIEVVVFLHGHTEGTHRPFAGWRALTGQKLTGLRQGIDKDDVAPVRDVALDQAPQQLDESGQTQTVIVLPQGGLHSQFGKPGDYSLSAKYVDEIVARLQSEKAWLDAKKQPVATAPSVGRVVMAGHSGAGATLAGMANQRAGTAAIGGDLVIMDAINGPGELRAFKTWARARLDADLGVLTDSATDEAAKLAYLRTAPKLRGYFTSGYRANYHLLDDDIADWFDDHAAELGAFAPCLRTNFMLVPVALEHEELMRGVTAGAARGKAGNIRDALVALHPPLRKSTADCPAMPARLSGKKPKSRPKAKALR